MNEIIKNQLKDIEYLISDLDDNKYEYFIPKQHTLDIQLGNYYLIELEDYIIHPSPSFNLHCNWNNNNVPKYKYMKCCIDQIMGKMVKLTGVAYDMDNKIDIPYSWSGWIPIKSMKLLERI